ncbi:MAG: DUF6502 family protein [Myxococcota bacterium]|nr:DUF6502 family protein [Myxococcota bacterium]
MAARPTDSATPAAAQPATALVRALRHLLQPLVRVLLRHQVTYPYLANLLKGVYVEMGEEELADASGPANASRLSLFTGIHRKDIRRLRDAPNEGYDPPRAVSLGARLVSQWNGASEVLDARGRPRPLARTPEADESGPCFDDLVASVSTDIRPRAVLDEWLRLGIAEVDANDRVRLASDAFVPSKGFDEKAHYFGRNLHDHLAAAGHNLEGKGAPLLERSVYYDGLTQESVEELAALSEELGMQALQAVNSRALKLQQRDTRRDGNLRMNFGLYFFRAKKERETGE